MWLAPRGQEGRAVRQLVAAVQPRGEDLLQEVVHVVPGVAQKVREVPLLGDARDGAADAPRNDFQGAAHVVLGGELNREEERVGAAVAPRDADALELLHGGFPEPAGDKLHALRADPAAPPPPLDDLGVLKTAARTPRARAR